MLSFWSFIHTVLFICTIILMTFSTPFMSSGGGSSSALVDARPQPAPMPFPRFEGRHKRKNFVIPNIHCPRGKTRGHDGDCYRIFQSHSIRNRRSVINDAPVITCPPGTVRGFDNKCNSIIPRQRRSPIFVPNIDQDCPHGTVRGVGGGCYRLFPSPSNRNRRSIRIDNVIITDSGLGSNIPLRL